MDKKGMLESTLGKVVFGLIVIITLLGILMVFSGALKDVWSGFLNAFRFGG